MQNIEKKLQSTPVASQWQRIGICHHHGINIPLFSLHSHQSCGIGEYTDLPLLFDWCKEVGIDTIQLLPLNDTGPDASPYSAISAFAINPIHLGLLHLPNIAHYPDLLSQIKEIQELTKLPRVDYSLVRPAKYRFLRDYFQYERENVFNSEEYSTFVDTNSWLLGYALFKALKVTKRWQSWLDWESYLHEPNQLMLKRLYDEFRGEIDFHLFIQYLCFKQFQDVATLAKQKEIFLKGDIPILISPESADVWLHSNIFQLDFRAGAPPDMFAPEGQNWGSPIYNWNEIEKTNFHWWKQRLKVSEQFYDLCRLDHIVGFFRVWSIPLEGSETKSRFIPEDSHTWIEHGGEILEMLSKNTTMLPIGEDLGCVPNSVRRFLTEMGICGTKVMRWERESFNDEQYINPRNYSPISMTTVSTHDTDTTHMWWRNTPEESKLYAEMKGWKYSPTLTSEQHFEILYDSHHSGSLFHINLLQEYLALFPDLRRPDTDDERVNYPSTVSSLNWTSRYQPSIEDILNHKNLYQSIKQIIK